MILPSISDSMVEEFFCLRRKIAKQAGIEMSGFHTYVKLFDADEIQNQYNIAIAKAKKLQEVFDVYQNQDINKAIKILK